MSLLTTVMTDTLDSGYAEATARRRAAGRPAGGLRQSPGLLAGLLVVGLLLATAAAEQRTRGGVSAGAQSTLAAEVAERTAANDRLAAAVVALRTDLDVTRDDALALTGEGADGARRLAALQSLTGVRAVAGPGIVLTLQDAPGARSGGSADPRDPASSTAGRVRDADLQRVVNGLWQVGAEAQSINGQRLTALTAIRSAGEAVLVAYRPLSPPYAVSAVGAPAALENGFRESDAGLALQAWAENYGLRFQVRRSDELVLPAASGTTLRYAVAG